MDIAELGYKVDSSGLVEGTKALDENAAAAEKAGAAAERLEKSQKDTGKSASFWANEQAKINARVQEMEQIEQRAGRATQQAARATEARELNLQKLLGQINPTVAALNKLAEQEDKLARARDLGLLKPQVWQQYQNQLDGTRAGILATSNSFGKLNLQTVEAQQTVAMLFRALATGNFAQVQSSITSLTARSGALSAVFSATGIAVAGLAVGLGAVAAITYSAQKEMDGYAAALLKSGNAAGLTSAGLRALANDIGKATGRYEDARKAVVALAEGGRLSGQLLAHSAAAAVSLAQVSGQDVSAAARQLEEIAKAPSKALIDLNSDYRFLTASVLEHVQSLEQQGRQTEAVAYATAEAAQEFDRRAEEMKAQTASLTGMVAALRSEWQAFTQDLRNLNTPTLDINIGALEQKLTSLQSGAFMGPRYLLPGARENDIGVLEEQLRVMREQRKDQQELAAGAALVNQLQQDGLDGYMQINSVLDRAKTSTEKLEESTRKLKASYEALKISNPASELLKGVQFGANGGISGGSYDKALAQLVKDSQKGQKKPGRNGDDSAAQNMLAAAQRQIEANKQLLETGVKVTESERQAMAIEQVLAKSKNTMTASTRALLTAAREELLASGQKAAAYTKEKEVAEALARQQAILAQASSNRARSNELDLMGMGRGSDAVSMLRRQLDIQREYQDELKRIGSRDVAADKASWDLLAANAAAYRDSELAKERTFQEQRLAMLGDWRAGVNRVWEDYVFAARNAMDQASGVMNTALGGWEDMWVRVAQTGKLSIRDMSNSIIADLARIGAKQAAVGLLGGLSGTGLGRFLGLGGGIGSVVKESIPLLGFGGGRARGGGVMGDSFYEVGEGGRPELFQQNGKRYLIPGNNGQVVPAAPMATAGTPSGSSAMRVEINNFGSNQVRAREESQRMPDGSELRRLVIDIVGDSLDGGDLAAVGKARFGWQETIG
ncbi:TPA: phage tail length tape measure family protein [Stenotrophomonas maltophilia]|nr:phage tail length tape measure family protein [Stenotrophomonas maltophilia]HEL5006695.1 phage tail length tape measure family protein [Stenotrophomonas maltophilia]